MPMSKILKLRSVTTGLLLCLCVLSFSHSAVASRASNGRIAFMANYTGTFQIYTVDSDGSHLFQVTHLPPPTDLFALEMDVSPDGSRILFPHDMTGALELYTIHADGTGLTQITHDGSFHAAPHWSPDGSHIVFATRGKRALLATATMRADGSDVKILTTPYWESLGAAYTSDGRHIVFSTQQDGLISALWIMDTEGKHQRRLTAPELEAGPLDVSSAGNEVVFYTHQDTPKFTSIFKISIDGSRVTRLTSDGHMDTLPVFSPDGRQILYMSDRLSPGSFDIFVMDVDGAHKRRLVHDAFYPAWSPKPAAQVDSVDQEGETESHRASRMEP
jgi:Tol biopolymer transport system component